VAAPYPRHASSPVQTTGMPMFPYNEQPCASQHDTDVSEEDTDGEDSRLAPVEAFRTTFNCN
jgi:hypothetical protein